MTQYDASRGLQSILEDDTSLFNHHAHVPGAWWNNFFFLSLTSYELEFFFEYQHYDDCIATLKMLNISFNWRVTSYYGIATCKRENMLSIINHVQNNSL